MARAQVQIKIDMVDAKAMAAAVDRCFDDLRGNIPALRETGNHNEMIKAQEALKMALLKKADTKKTATKQEA